MILEFFIGLWNSFIRMLIPEKKPRLPSTSYCILDNEAYFRHKASGFKPYALVGYIGDNKWAAFSITLNNHPFLTETLVIRDKVRIRRIDYIDDGIVILDVSHQKLREINIPPHINMLFCNNNDIEEIDIPETLSYILCDEKVKNLEKYADRTNLRIIIQ